VSVEEQLRWEAGARRWAAATALGAGALLLGAIIPASITSRDAPEDAPGAPIANVEFIHHHATALTVVAVLFAIGTLLIAAALVFLYRATKFRRPQLQNVALFMAVFGPIGRAVGLVVQQVAISHAATDAVTNHPGNYFVARDIGNGGAVLAGAILGQVGALAMGFALVLLALNAMRVGLLTRFMGWLGIIVGVLFVVPLGSPLPIVQGFWLLALGVLFAGRWPSGTPAAWETGTAIPWPTQQELRERREEVRDRGGGRPRREPAPVVEGTAEPVGAGAPNPSASKKRKRKKRR
jgi:hypothetical protein